MKYKAVGQTVVAKDINNSKIQVSRSMGKARVIDSNIQGVSKDDVILYEKAKTHNGILFVQKEHIIAKECNDERN